MSYSFLASRARRRLRPFAAALAFSTLGAGVAHASPLSAPAPAIPGDPTARAANDAYVKGVTALNEARLDEAAAAFRQSAAIDPKAPGPYLALAEIASRQGNDAGVKEALDSALKAAPDNADVQIARGRYAFLHGRNDEAVAAYRAAIARRPNEARSHLDLADIYLTRLNQPGQALAEYRAALQIQPANGGAQFGIGRSLAATGELDGAADAFTKAQRLSPANPLPSFALGEIEARRGRGEAAMAALNAALATSPSFVPARIARGDLFASQGKPREAEEDYRAALAQDPQSAAARIGLGVLQQQSGRTADAESSYRQALTINPKSPIALNNLAWILAQKRDDLANAQRYAEQAIELGGGSPMFRTTLGWVLRQRGESEQAAAELEAAAKAQPTAERYFMLGVARADMKNAGQASAAFRQALAISPDYAPAKQALAVLPSQ